MGLYDPSNFEIWCKHRMEPLREAQRNHPARRARATPRITNEET